MNDNQQKSGLALGSLALGAIAGAIAGVLLAPRSGKETRDEIKDTLTRMKDEIAAKVSELKEVTEPAYQAVVETVVKTYQEAKNFTADDAASIIADLKQGYDEVREAMNRTRNNVKDDVQPV